MLYILLVISGLSSHLNAQDNWMEHYDFVYLDDILQKAIYDVRYASEYNFVGTTVNGYHSERLVMTRKAALALSRAEQKFNELGYGLKIFDTYRPQRAVDHFVTWAKDRSDTLTKKIFYPNQDKRYLFNLGYISSRSGHTRGSTIDLTLYSLEDGLEVDMGGPYDYFGVVSQSSNLDIEVYLSPYYQVVVFALIAKNGGTIHLRMNPIPTSTLIL